MAAPASKKNSPFKKQWQSSSSGRATNSSLWRNEAPETNLREVPSLPLESLEALSVATLVQEDKQRSALNEKIKAIKNALMQAERQAILARSNSIPLGKRQGLCQEAWQKYESAVTMRNSARSLSTALGLEDRRRVRAIEGAPEWRSIRHAIQQAAVLNQIRLQAAA